MFKLTSLDKVSFILVLLGAINWGVIGITNLDLVELIFGSVPIIQRIIYILIGAAAINILVVLFRTGLVAVNSKR